MGANDLRRTHQARIGHDKELSPESVNQVLQQLSKAVQKLEGRAGTVEARDAIKITTDRFTALEIDSAAGGKAAIVAFGTDNSGIAIAKGSKRNDEGQWIATDTTSVIWAVSREGWASLYVNSGLRIGEAFTPIVVVTIPGGTNPLIHNQLAGRSDPNAHPATAITNTPFGLLASTNVQAALNELDDEKLARSGVQPMLGHLDMNSNDIDNIKNATFNGGVGDATLNNVRKLHMIGNESDLEARIDGIKAAVFSSVAPTAEVGRLSWDSTDKTLVYFVNSGT